MQWRCKLARAMESALRVGLLPVACAMILRVVIIALRAQERATIWFLSDKFRVPRVLMSSSRNHLLAMAIACLLIFGFRIQDYDLQPLLGQFDDRWYHDYTPYFPGIHQLEKHEIFSPRYRNKKKIVLLGGSTVDAIGCDFSWSRTDPTVQPKINASYVCSIAASLNEQLQAAGFNDWRVFNLARNGAYLTTMLYVYARVSGLKPEIVVYGDIMSVYLANNADANVLKADDYAYLDKVFGATPSMTTVWRAYRENLMKHGWQPPAETAGVNDISPEFQPRERTTLSNILLRLIVLARNSRIADGPPFPVKFIPFRNWEVKPYVPYTAKHPDEGFGYFQGIKLIAQLQRQHGGKLLFYFSPFYDGRRDLTYINFLNDVFGAYLTDNGIPFASYVALELKPIYETYDGWHQTVYGNRVIAATLLNDLIERGLIHQK
jgi:hypothetical protein